MKKCVITVVGKDTVGNISQTIVDGYFNMMMIVDVTNCSKEVAVVSKELEEIGTSIGVAIHCQREEIFEKMHRL